MSLVQILVQLVLGLTSGLLGAGLVSWISRRCRVQEEKRRALRDYFARFRYQKASRDFELLNEVYISFSDSPEVLKRLIGLRDEGTGQGYTRARKELVATMCEASGVKYDEFLNGNDICICGKS